MPTINPFKRFKNMADGKKPLHIAVPIDLLEKTAEHARSMHMSRTRYVILSLYRTLSEGLYNSEKQATATVLLSDDVNKKIMEISNNAGINKATVVNHLLTKAIERYNSVGMMDTLIDTIIRERK